MYNQPK